MSPPPDPDPTDDQRWMRAALALARRGLGRSWPNPAVGCVLVREGAVVGRGWTQPGGRPHAEAMALAQAGAAARGASAYVTLEPCAHHGRTPPCAEALVRSGVVRLVSGLEDPDPRVSGRGHAMLRHSGVAVATDVLGAECRDANEGFLRRVTDGRPMLTLKLAATLDGRIATATGESRWITGPQARSRVHLLRARHDAVLIGAGTARADDPMLDVRLPGLEDASPVRVVADSALGLAADSRLAKTATLQPLWIAHADAAAEDRRAALIGAGATLLPVARSGEEGLDPVALLAALGAQGLTRALCEGGGRLAASLLRARLVDRLVWVVAGAAIGAEGAPAIGPLGLDRLADAPRFALARSERLGADLWSEWRPAAGA